MSFAEQTQKITNGSGLLKSLNDNTIFQLITLALTVHTIPHGYYHNKESAIISRQPKRCDTTVMFRNSIHIRHHTHRR